MAEYWKRIVDEELQLRLEAFGATLIVGPKWCGKTTTGMQKAKSVLRMQDPDMREGYLMTAQTKPSLLLKGDTPRLIDEWQEIPTLWDAVRFKVDQTTQKGQFILTGSATPNHKGILHSGAGRIARLRMRTMSLWESGDSTGEVSLERLCHGELKPVMSGDVSLIKLIELIIRGGWPGSLGLPEKQAKLLPAEYLNAVIDDDVYRIDGVKRDSHKMHLLLRSLARNESTTVTNKTLMKDIRAMEDEDIDANTVAAYLDIFKRLFITENQPPFSSGIRSSVRVKQAEKRHFADPSLACALLNATTESLMGDLETLEFLFEALCERDLRIYAESFDAHLYHYQDYQNQEIDAVIELPDGQWCAFEIKLGAHQIDAAADNLNKIRSQIDQDPKGKAPSVCCVLCGMSNAAYQRPDGVFVVPITALKN